MRLIDADALKEKAVHYSETEYHFDHDAVEMDDIDNAPTIDAVPIKFIDEVIEFLTKCRDYAIHEETKTSWDEQRQTLIMLLHEWAAWNECGRTGKYGERMENDEAD